MCFNFKIIKCPVCLDKISNLNALICGHVVCPTCSDRLEHRLKIKCPVCRTRSFIIKVKNITHTMQCHRSVTVEAYRRTCRDVRMWELPLVHLSHTTCFDFYFYLKK